MNFEDALVDLSVCMTTMTGGAACLPPANLVSRLARSQPIDLGYSVVFVSRQVAAVLFSGALVHICRCNPQVRRNLSFSALVVLTGVWTGLRKPMINLNERTQKQLKGSPRAWNGLGVLSCVATSSLAQAALLACFSTLPDLYGCTLGATLS